MDNRQIKDGVGNLFTLRMRDKSASGDGSIQQTMLLSSGYPLDYGTGGMFQHCGKSGAMVAGLAANAPIYAFHWPANLMALVRRVRISAWTLGTAFAAGLATFDLYAARSFTAQYGGGNVANLSGEAGQLRTSMNSFARGNYVCGNRRAHDRNANARSRSARIGDRHRAGSNQCAIHPSAAHAVRKSAGPPSAAARCQRGICHSRHGASDGLWSFAVTTEWDEVEIF